MPERRSHRLIRRTPSPGQARLVADLRIIAPAADERPALRGQRPVLDSIADARPRLKRRRRQEPTALHRLLGVGDAAPDVDTALGGTSQKAGGGLDDGRK